MNGNNFTRITGSKRNLFALLASSALFTSGCANMATTATTATSANSLSSGATIGGKLHGGSQPIAGATVTLYYAGQSGVGSGVTQGGDPIVGATTTTADDGFGSFSFIKNPLPNQAASGNTFSCPDATGDAVVYVVARGGNTLNTHDSSVSNSAAVFIGMYGLCSQISNASFLNLNEVTTVATMAAVQQYFNPVTETIGADGIGVSKIALVNTLGTIANLANTATGTVVTSTQLAGGGGDGVSAVTVTATPESGKVNELANILSACVNNASASATPCTTLFANATPPDVKVTARPYKTPAFTQATDTLQALYYMLTNPTNGSTTNFQNLFNLSPAVGAPFQPSLSVAPTDWTIAIRYSSNSTCGASTGSFINKPQDLNIDSSGNLWIVNGEATKGNLSAISASGAPVACVFLNGGSSGGGTIDPKGNIWYATSSANNIYRYNPLTRSVLTYTTAAPPLAVTADGADNIYFSTSTDGSLYKITDGATEVTASTPVQISSVLGPLPIHIMPDYSGAIWASSGSNFVSRVGPGTVGDTNYLGGYTTTPFTTLTDTYGIAVTHLNNVFVSSAGSNSSISYLTGSGTSYSLFSGWPTPAGLGGINNPTSVAIDGQLNVWTPNNTSNSGSGLDSVSEISYLQANLTTNGTVAGGRQFTPDYLTGGRAMVIDMSGNVWVAGDGTVANPSIFITQIVGAAVPIYQPYARGLYNGRFQTIP